MRKKFAIGIIAGAMVLSLVGCGSNSSAESTEKASVVNTGIGEQDMDKAKKQTIGQAGEETGKPAEEATEIITPEVTSEEESPELMGGWTAAEDPRVTEEHKKLFEKACETLTGAVYTPILYLGSQVVAGTNYRFLCKMEASVAELKSAAKYAIVTIYEDLQGNASILELKDSDVELPPSDEMLVGAYEAGTDLKMTEEAKTAFVEATSTITGVEYRPVALLGSQVVAGMNYRILCESRVVNPDAEPGYTILTIYAPLNGSASITDTADIR